MTSVLTLKSLEALGQLANGTATKIVVPSDLQGIAGLATSLAGDREGNQGRKAAGK